MEVKDNTLILIYRVNLNLKETHIRLMSLTEGINNGEKYQTPTSGATGTGKTFKNS